MRSYTIDIDYDLKCKRCGKRGATTSGLCLACVIKLPKANKQDKQDAVTQLGGALAKAATK